jgi:rsbT co-antagonist protein RsbR
VRTKELIGNRVFRALIEKAPDGIVLLGADGTIRYYSPAIKHIMGHEEGEMIGSSFSEFLHPDDQQTAIDLLDSILQDSGATASAELRARHKDASWHSLEATATNHIDDPDLGAVVVNFRDITDRKQADEEYNRGLELYQRLVEHIPDALMVVDGNGHIVFESSGDLLGFQPGELKGRMSWDLIHPDDLPSVMEIFADAAQRPHAIERVDCRYKHSDGTWHSCQTMAVNCFDSPAVGGFIAIIRDITELRNTEGKLRELTRKLRLALEELSTPVVQVWDGVLAVPLVGVMDERRAKQTTEVLLTKIVQTQSELIIVDVTGVPSLDTYMLNHLMRTVQAAIMLGARCVVTGMQPDFAQSVTKLDLDLSKVVIKRDLQDGLKWALGERGSGAQGQP